MIQLVLPAHLRTLARIDSDLWIDAGTTPTIRSALDSLEELYPMLRGTIRDYQAQERRPFLRFFACGQDVSHDPVDRPLAEEVASGREPLIILAAVAGGLPQ